MIYSPTLICDIEKLKQNISTMQSLCWQHHIQLRPMVKTHKCSHIIRMQLEASSDGVLVSNVKEALLAKSVSCKSITVAYPLVQKELYPIYKDLFNDVDLTFTVDTSDHISSLKECFSGQKAVKVVIKIDSGLHRFGVLPEDTPSLEKLAKAIVAEPCLKLEGVATHAGQVYASHSLDEVKQIAKLEQDGIRKACSFLESITPIHTAAIGSTPTVISSESFEGITEVRPGNYVFFDLTQLAFGVTTLEQCALKVRACVLSRPTPYRAIINAGSKQLGLDKGAHGSQTLRSFGYIQEDPDADLFTLSEELGWLRVPPKSTLKSGDIIHIIPNHACVTASCYRKLHIVDNQGMHMDTWELATGN